jgi:hypothetical protein
LLPALRGPLSSAFSSETLVRPPTGVKSNQGGREMTETAKAKPEGQGGGLDRLLDEWLADESGYDEEAWLELKEALDRDRLSYRRLFVDQ